MVIALHGNRHIDCTMKDLLALKTPSRLEV